MSSIWRCLLLLSLVALAAEARRLRARDWGPEEHGDASGTEVLSNARNMNPAGSGSMKAFTPEAAEATANSHYNHLYRRQKGADSTVTWASVEGDPVTVNPDRKKEAIKPRARSAQDIPNKPQPNLASGAAQLPTVSMGAAAVATTYEGATAAALSDSITINGRNFNLKKTVNANSMLTAVTSPLRKASKVASFGPTAQTAGSAAFSGPGDGNIAMANAGEVSAVAQASKSTNDQWQSDPRDKGVGKGKSK